MGNENGLETNKGNLVVRWIVYIIGIYMVSVGVSLAIRAGIGVSPQTAFERTFVVNIPFLTQGMANFILEIIMLILAFLVYRKGFKLYHLLGIITAAVMGSFLDLNLSLSSFLQPDMYVFKLLTLCIGDASLAFGVFLMIQSNVVLMPIDNFVNSIHLKYRKKWGNIKTCFDLSLLISAAIAGLLLAHKIMFIREGTVLNAILVGQYIRLYTFLYRRIKTRKPLDHSIGGGKVEG